MISESRGMAEIVDLCAYRRARLKCYRVRSEVEEGEPWEWFGGTDALWTEDDVRMIFNRPGHEADSDNILHGDGCCWYAVKA